MESNEMILTALLGVAGEICLLAVNTETVTLWVTCICSALITVATCLIQVYRIFRDKDSDKDDKDDTNDDSQNNEDTGDNNGEEL